MLGALACPECHSLLHGEELTKLSGLARGLEQQGCWGEARETWNHSLALLPPDSKQAEWVREKMAQIARAQAAPAETRKAAPTWVRRFGPLAPLVIVLAKSKGLLLAVFKLKFLFSFFSFIAIYVSIFGWWFGLGFAASILIHEMGHYIDIKRRGLPAEAPVFVPGLGAYVRWNALGVTKRQIAQISLAGPLAGWVAAVGCLWMYLHTGEKLWAALAQTGAVINVLNLVPVWELDGGKAAESLGKTERVCLLAVALLLWSYTGSGVYFLVAAGTVYRLFTKDTPKRDDWSTFIYFAAVLALLGVVLHLIPAKLM